MSQPTGYKLIDYLAMPWIYGIVAIIMFFITIIIVDVLHEIYTIVADIGVILIIVPLIIGLLIKPAYDRVWMKKLKSESTTPP